MGVALEILTPNGRAWQGDVESVVLPGDQGDFGVLDGHERFLSALRVGEVAIHSGGATTWAAISTGFAEVNADRIHVLVDTCEVADQIDTARAERALTRAEQQLVALESGAEDRRREDFLAALARARTRLAVSRRSGS
jgi:F-type H+-transporting ATPase subunit epsilon